MLGTRYYGGVATRTANTDSAGKYTTSTLTWNMTDHHGTGTIAINPATLQVDRRRSLPYGGPRGTQATGFGNKGFVGGTTDPTGLTHLGAREYDPFLGRFLSVDPMFDGTDPQSWNGYAYADNSPITLSDPTGLIADDFEGCFACQQDPTGQKARDYESPTAKRVKRDQEFKRKRQGLNRLVDLVPDGEADLEKLSDFLNGDYRAPAMDIANNLLFGSDGDVAPPFGRDEFTDRAMILQGCLKVAMACTENYIQDLTLSCRCQITQIEESGVGGRTLARLLRGASLDRGAFAKQVAEDIGNGHAFDKHFLRKGEFPELRTRFQFKAAIEEVITKGKYRDLSNGRQGFWYNGTVVIRNPNAIDGGTAFKAGKEYFQGLR